MKPAHLLGLAAIVLLGAFLRLYQVDVMKFGDEEATQLRLALDWLEQGRFPLVGLLTSMGLYRPAGFPYLLVPFVLLARHPLLATALVSLLNVVSIALAYRIVRTYFGHREAALASLAYASSFWAAYASRHLWDQSLMAPVALLVLEQLLAAAIQRRAGALGWAVFWTSAGTLVHPSAAVLLGVVAVVALALRLPLRPSALGVPFLFAVVIWVPFLSYLVLSQGRDLRLAGDLLARPPTTDLEGIRLALWQLFPHPEEPLFQATQGSVVPGSLWLQWLHPAMVLLFLASLTWCARRGLPALRRTDHPGNAYLVVVLAYVVPLGLLLRHSLPIYNHYVYLLLPFAAIILALGLLAAARGLLTVLSRLRRTRDPRPETRDRAFRWALAVMVALAAGQLWFLLAYVHWLTEKGTTFGSGVPFRSSQYALAAATSLRASPSDPIHIASRPESALLYGYLVSPAVIVDHERTLVFSAGDGPLVYMTVADDSRAASLLRQRFPASERFHLFRTYAVMAGMGGTAIATSFPDPQQLRTLRASPPDYYRVYLLPPDAGRLAQEAALRIRGPWLLDNGMRVEGYDVANEIAPGHELLLTLAWTVTTGPRTLAGDQRLFAHLLDRLGRKWAEASELDYPPQRWREGDRVISWVRVPVPPEAPQGLYTLSFGMFDAQSQERIGISSPRQPADSIATRSLRVTPSRPPQPPARPLAPPARFGGSLELLGYDLPPSATSGAPLDLRLLWRPTQSLTTDYTLFVHLLDQQGQMLAQDDGFPAGGLYPTSAWRPGEPVEDYRHIPIPLSAAGQQLSIALGWYRLDTGQRLLLDDGTGSESAFLLGPVTPSP